MAVKIEKLARSKQKYIFKNKNLGLFSVNYTYKEETTI